MRRGVRILAVTLLVLAALPAVVAAQTTERSFRLGFTPLPPVYSQLGLGVAYSYLQREGDLVSHTLQYGVPWAEALRSSDPATFPAGLRAMWANLAATDALFLPGHARYISITPINYGYDGLAEYWGDQPSMPLGAPWSGYGFDRPEVRQAYLNYAVAVVEFFHPTYLGIAVEANILLARAPGQWNAYKALNAYVYAELKRRYPALTVFAPIQYEHMLGLQYESALLRDQVKAWWPTVLEDEVRSLMANSDLLVLSTYPFMVANASRTAAHYADALALAQQTGRRIAIEQTGDTSQNVQVYYSLLAGTESSQAAFIAMILDLAASARFAFVVNFVAIDYGYNYGTDPASLTWAFTGLWRPDGSAKPAADVWRSYLQRPLAAR